MPRGDLLPTRLAFYAFYMPFRIKRFGFNRLRNYRRAIFVRFRGGLALELIPENFSENSYVIPLEVYESSTFPEYSTSSMWESYRECLVKLGVNKADNLLVFPTPSSLIVISRSRFGRTKVTIVRRGFDCRHIDVISHVKIMSIMSDPYGFLMFFRYRGKPYVLLDSIHTSLNIRLHNNPARVEYRKSIAVLHYNDYTMLITPHSVVETPFSLKQFEVIGVVADEGIYVRDKENNHVYVIDKMGTLEPVTICRNIVGMPFKSGNIIPYCIDINDALSRRIEAFYSDALKFLHETRLDRSYILLPYIVVVDGDRFYVLYATRRAEGELAAVRVASYMGSFSLSFERNVPENVKELIVNEVLSGLHSVVDGAIVLASNANLLVDQIQSSSLLFLDVIDCGYAFRNKLDLDYKLHVGNEYYKPLKSIRLSDCHFRLIYSVPKLKELKESAASLDWGGSLERVDLHKMKKVEIAVEKLFLKLRYEYLNLYTINAAFLVEGCRPQRVSLSSPDCIKAFFTTRHNGVVILRAYCKTTSPRGFLIVGCGDIDVRLILNLQALARSAFLKELDTIASVMLEPKPTFDLIVLHGGKHGMLAFGDCTGLLETVEGNVVFRLPSKCSKFYVLEKRGIKEFEYVSTKAPVQEVRIVVSYSQGQYNVLVGCESECIVNFKDELVRVQGAGTSIQVPPEEILGDDFQIVVYGSRGVKVFNRDKILERLLTAASYIAVRVCKSSKLC